MPISRREFLGSVAVTAIACALPPRPARSSHLKVGYASITWGGRDLLAINEIAALGYAGIQVRANMFAQFRNQPSALRDILAQHELALVALSSGDVIIDPAAEAKMLAEHAARARFVHDVGGAFLQVTDAGVTGRPVTEDDCTRLAGLLTEIGKRSADVGIPLAYHPHMGTIGEKPDDADRILAAADAQYVKLLLDVAHYQQGGGDPAVAIRRHKDRLAFLHLKDVEAVSTAPGYRFVELGRGHVNLDAVFTALRDVSFDGWAVVELDSVPDPSRTPNDSAAINKRYLESHGFALR